MSFLSYHFLIIIFLLLLSDETKLPKMGARQHFMAEHLWKCPTARCVYFEFPWDTAKMLFERQQVTGVILEVSGASFHGETAGCVWERGLNNPNSFWVTVVGIFAVGKRVAKLRLSDTGFPSCCLTLGVVSLISFHSLPFFHTRGLQWEHRNAALTGDVSFQELPSTKPHTLGNKRQSIWALCAVAAAHWQGHIPMSLSCGGREPDSSDSPG